VRFTSAALAVILCTLAVAEVVRPTTFVPKRVSHASLARVNTNASLDRVALDDLPPVDDAALGNVDVLTAVSRSGRPSTILPDVPIALDATITLVGWCADPRTRAPAQGLFLIVDARSRIVERISYGGMRPDVAAHFASERLTRVGYSISIDAARLGRGSHSLQIGAIASGGSGYYRLPTISSVTIAAR